VTGDSQALETYFTKHPDAAKFARSPMKNQDLRQILFKGSYAYGHGSRPFAGGAGRSSVTIEPSVESSAESVQVTTPLHGKRAAVESPSALTKRARGLATDLYHYLDELTTALLAATEGSSRSVKTTAIKLLHKHFGVLLLRVKLTVLMAFEADFAARNFMLMPPEIKKLWVRNEILARTSDLLRHGVNAAAVVEGFRWEGAGDIELYAY
jgi:hypothetical protein